MEALIVYMLNNFSVNNVTREENVIKKSSMSSRRTELKEVCEKMTMKKATICEAFGFFKYLQ